MQLEVDIAADFLGAMRDAAAALGELSKAIHRIERDLDRCPMGKYSSDLYEPIRTVKAATQTARNAFFDAKIAIEGMV